ASLKVTVASASVTTLWRHKTLSGDSILDVWLSVVSVIVSVRGAPRSAEVSRSMGAPLALAVLPASSVTLRTELTGPSERLDRLEIGRASCRERVWMATAAA